MKRTWPSTRDEVEERRYNREMLTDHIRKRFDFSRTDQSNRIKEPPFEKPPEEGAALIELPKRRDWSDLCDANLAQVMANRRSRRSFTDNPLSLEEISFLLWASQGIREGAQHHFRMVPSAGARHSFETYLAIGNVSGLKEGIYRFIPSEHSLTEVRIREDIIFEVAAASFNQMFISDAAAVFIWTTIPYRMEWRYGPAAHRVIALDAGHVCQNLYLAAEGIDAGTCGIGAYDQERMDRLIGVDGEDEFVLYMAPVGKIR